MIMNDCQVCNTPFRAHRHASRFCSRDCQYAAAKRAPNKRISKRCVMCKAKFTTERKWVKNCSQRCVGHYNSQTRRSCQRDRDGYVGWMFGGKCPESPGTPTKGPEGCTRRIGCRHYSQCLDVAAFYGWRGFECDQCTAFEPDFRVIEIRMPSPMGAAVDMGGDLNDVEAMAMGRQLSKRMRELGYPMGIRLSRKDNASK